MKKCPYCKATINDGARICPDCKKEIPYDKILTITPAPAQNTDSTNTQLHEQNSRGSENIGIGTCTFFTATIGIQFGLAWGLSDASVGAVRGLITGALGGALLGLIIGLIFCHNEKNEPVATQDVQLEATKPTENYVP